MKYIEQAEQLLQRAYDIDIEKEQGVLDLGEEFKRTPPINVHYVYYNSGLAQHPEVRRHLQEFPDGELAKLLQAVRDVRVQAGEYRQATLNKMYGLPND